MDQILKDKIIVLTGGGTAGHITPNFALIGPLQDQGAHVVYIGLKDGMEAQLVKAQDIPFYGISGGKFRRNFKWRNLTDLFRIMCGFFQSIGVLWRLKPHLVFSKGGFVTAPVVWAAWILRIPVLLHESDLTPGLANKLSIPFSKKIAYAFKETKAHLPTNKSVYTGLPVRESLFKGNRQIGLDLCGFEGDKPVLLITGGSQGALSINRLIRAHLDALMAEFDICHLVGKGNLDTSLSQIKGYTQIEYVSEGMEHLYACADCVISRAGATTIFELLALKKPHILIPLGSKATRGDQILNAQSFEVSGYSLVLEDQRDADLMGAIRALKERASDFKKAMDISQADAIAAVIRLISELQKA